MISRTAGGLPEKYSRRESRLKKIGSDANQNYAGDLIARTTDSSHGLNLMDIPDEYKRKEEPAVGFFTHMQGTENMEQS
ncbi:hypothetical protein ES705_40362 [subsurface metagenome]